MARPVGKVNKTDEQGVTVTTVRLHIDAHLALKMRAMRKGVPLGLLLREILETEAKK